MKSYPPVTDCWFLTGPTAAGKSDVAVALAQRLCAEILSLDSMAVYRGMDLGTAKPDAAARAAVPHHLLDLVEPNEEFSIAQYLEAAHRALEEVRGRGRQVLFVGGTPLYLKALLCGIAEGPPADWELRRRLMAEAAEAGPEALHERLSRLDPVAAARLHPHDTRRVIRALEVFEMTGHPISEGQEHFHRAESAAPGCRVMALDWPRSQLHERISLRVDAIFSAGLVDEVRSLLARCGGLSRTAEPAAGYREVIEHLQGVLSLPDAIERTKVRTRQLARRQLIWLRSLPECQWLALSEPLSPGQVVEQIFSASPVRRDD